MKTILNFFILFLAFSFFKTYSQNYNLNYFLVGFVSDYMGRNIEKGQSENINSIDYHFHKTRLHSLYRLDTLIKIHIKGNEKIVYEIKREVTVPYCKNYNEFYILNSEYLKNNINSFFIFKKIEENSNIKVQQYNGTLNENKILFSKKSNIISFLAGAFYTFGDKDSTGYFYKFSNSTNKRKIIYKILKKYNCKIVKEFDNQVKGQFVSPYIYTMYFIPSDEMKIKFDYELDIRQKIKKLKSKPEWE
ncbi:hypothetical protein FLBR109950_03530 [Flavobacterium branchiophilum]|uniref:Uncharacterized protein n=1 Tax=Flavobacterium branchiophilum (strain FL-15) TaxID=1034807 RepID=G2Z2P0_FLABF|nr:hypothetical protein [Flavobacterium branchiophilum]CCB70213.1 Hypothetical protein precursor [Flavobacterium branchiophilum FL-15]